MKPYAESVKDSTAKPKLAALARAYLELLEVVEFLVNGEPKNGDQGKACTFCDMGGAGYSSKGDGHHDDIRDVCPVFMAEQVLSKHGETK